MEAVKVALPQKDRAAIEELKSGNLINKLKENVSRDVVFAVVGYAGSGTSFVGHQLKAYLDNRGYKAYEIKARAALDEYANKSDIRLPDSSLPPIERTMQYQRIGDQLRQRSGEYGSVAAFMIRAIRRLCDQSKPEDKNVYILDSLKHPDEVSLLRHLYGNSFCLIGVGCKPDIRSVRLQTKFNIGSAADTSLIDFVDRDAEDSNHKYGQQVNNTFHRADYFVDNTPSRENAEQFVLPDELKRLSDIVFTGKIHRPRAEERGMYFANASAMRSSCLSRQVGAAILSSIGDLISTGSNEVPKFGGGSYDELSLKDDRCFRERKECSNTVEQNKILDEIFNKLSSSGLLSSGVTLRQVNDVLKPTRVKALLEFSRSVHAEMDALLSLVRFGTKLPDNSILFTTTYPCHNCARHIVAAGIIKVVYLEPYSKSMAIDLHNDSIADNKSEKESASKVRFVPYQGVSPRLYKTVYLKEGELKDKDGKLLPDQDMRRDSNVIWTKTYKEFEDDVIQFVEEEILRGKVQNGDS